MGPHAFKGTIWQKISQGSIFQSPRVNLKVCGGSFILHVWFVYLIVRNYAQYYMAPNGQFIRVTYAEKSSNVFRPEMRQTFLEINQSSASLHGVRFFYTLNRFEKNVYVRFSCRLPVSLIARSRFLNTNNSVSSNSNFKKFYEQCKGPMPNRNMQKNQKNRSRAHVLLNRFYDAAT